MYSAQLSSQTRPSIFNSCVYLELLWLTHINHIFLLLIRSQKNWAYTNGTVRGEQIAILQLGRK